jgi:hypothetical protein
MTTTKGTCPWTPSSNVDGWERGGALVGDRPKPWWQDDPELEEIRRRTLEEFTRELEEREPLPSDSPDPVLDDLLGGGSWRELALTRDDLSRSRARYERATEGPRCGAVVG